LKPGYLVRIVFIRRTKYLSFIWASCTQQTFKVHAGYHVLELAIAILVPDFGIKDIIAQRQKDGSDIYFYLLFFLIKVNGLIITNSFADTAFIFFKVETVFINIGYKGYCLSKVDMDCFVLRYLLIKWIRDVNRAVFCTSTTTSAFVLFNVSRLSGQRYIKIPCLSFYFIDFCIG